MNLFGHTRRDLYLRARTMGVAVPETNVRERCQGPGCTRIQQVDMLQRHEGLYICDGCWKTLQRKGLLGPPRG